jgi:radical SAM family uncharacterized protein/radical SAM-linked protein
MKNADIEKVLKSVQKPGRYIGGEWNIRKKDPGKIKIKVALAFPDIYEVGMSYLGHRILYHVLNSQPFILAERVYAPWIDFESVLRENDIPLYSLENKIPLHDFDIIGFSLLYELNYSNILTILDLGKVPLYSKKRNLGNPLVIAGGPAASNPEPISDFFDLFLIGDGEKAFIEIIDHYLALKSKGQDKESILRSMTNIQGVYVPSFYSSFLPSSSRLLAEKADENAPGRIKKNSIRSFEEKDIPSCRIVPNIKTIFDRVNVEVARGCAQNCRFCQARSVYFPLRNKEPKMVVGEVMDSLDSTGYEEASLSALSVGDYPDLDRIVTLLMDEFDKKKISLSLSALRPKFLTDKVAESIVRVKKTGFTIVPEAGTERLRRVINKKLKEEEILEAVSSAFSKGWRKIKLYFMVGLPTEKKEDLEGIISLIEKIIRSGYQILKKPPQINLSISSFIPKPHTPFQWVRMNSAEELRNKHDFLRKKLKKYGFVWFKEHPIESSVLEGIFSRGDRRLNSVLFRAWKKGARFDGWSDVFDFSIWEESFEEEGLSPERYLSSYSQKSVLPWEHIDVGIKKSYFKKELKKAFAERWTENCDKLDCRRCRGCSFPGTFNKVDSSDIPLKSLSGYRFGKKADRTMRYRLFYGKEGPARFLSHNDLIHIIQRSMRRAGFQVELTQGFHPKMKISFPPALALGMEGKKEVLEFRSEYLFENNPFVSRINNFFPAGVKALGLEKVKHTRPPLSKDIGSMVYSFDLKQKDIQESLRNRIGQKAEDLSVSFQFIKKVLNEKAVPGLSKVSFDEKKGSVLLEFLFSPGKAVRIKSVLQKVFEVEYPNFIATREKINFMPEKTLKA